MGTNAQEQYERFTKGLLAAFHIDSTRTLSLLDDVWERIPEEDREILLGAITHISDEPDAVRSDIGRVFGSAHGGFSGDSIDGVPCTSPWHAVVFLNSGVLSECDDAAAKAVIAHELAHVVLRHASMNHPFASASILGAAQEKAKRKVSQVHEWEADLQAWMWGFSEELHSMWEHLEAEPPAWYHKLE